MSGRMRTIGSPALLATVLAVAAAAGQEGVQLQPGLYRTTFELSMEGEKHATETNDECMTAEDLAQLGRGFLDADELTCKISEHKKTKGKETFVATCTDEDGQRNDTTGELTGGGEAFRFRMTLAMPDGPPLMMSWTGRRIGACKK